MFEVIPFKLEHVLPFLEQRTNERQASFFAGEEAKALENLSSFTGVLNGEPVICGGIVEIWSGRGQIWCVFNENSKQNFVPVFRGIAKFLDNSPFKRIECSTPVESEKDGIQHHRRMRLLGFKMECAFAEKYLPNGDDCALFSRVRA